MMRQLQDSGVSVLLERVDRCVMKVGFHGNEDDNNDEIEEEEKRIDDDEDNDSDDDDDDFYVDMCHGM